MWKCLKTWKTFECNDISHAQTWFGSVLAFIGMSSNTDPYLKFHKKPRLCRKSAKRVGAPLKKLVRARWASVSRTGLAICCINRGEKAALQSKHAFVISCCVFDVDVIKVGLCLHSGPISNMLFSHMRYRKTSVFVWDPVSDYITYEFRSQTVWLIRRRPLACASSLTRQIFLFCLQKLSGVSSLLPWLRRRSGIFVKNLQRRFLTNFVKRKQWVTVVIVGLPVTEVFARERARFEARLHPWVTSVCAQRIDTVIRSLDNRSTPQILHLSSADDSFQLVCVCVGMTYCVLPDETASEKWRTSRYVSENKNGR